MNNNLQFKHKKNSVSKIKIEGNCNRPWRNNSSSILETSKNSEAKINKPMWTKDEHTVQEKEIQMVLSKRKEALLH